MSASAKNVKSLFAKATEMLPPEAQDRIHAAIAAKNAAKDTDRLHAVMKKAFAPPPMHLARRIDRAEMVKFHADQANFEKIQGCLGKKQKDEKWSVHVDKAKSLIGSLTPEQTKTLLAQLFIHLETQLIRYIKCAADDQVETSNAFIMTLVHIEVINNTI